LIIALASLLASRYAPERHQERPTLV